MPLYRADFRRGSVRSCECVCIRVISDGMKRETEEKIDGECRVGTPATTENLLSLLTLLSPEFFSSFSCTVELVVRASLLYASNYGTSSKCSENGRLFFSV